MDESKAIEVLAALAQPTRMRAFRRLVRDHPAGLPAGELATFLGVPHISLSTHLATLERADLVSSTRNGRSIRYRIEPSTVHGVVSFLLNDCCGGRPEICAPLADQLACMTCETPEMTDER